MSARTTITTWLVRALLLLLVASFALWGIADVFQSGASGNFAAKVGNKTISVTDYQYSLDGARNNLQQMMGENYNAAMLKNLNVEKQVLTNLVNDVTLDIEAERYGIKISDEEILNDIRNTPAFLGEKGVFDKTVFEQTLKGSGMTEAMYVAQIKQDKARKLLTETLMQLDLYPTQLANILHKAALEKRHVSIWNFDVARSASASLKPSEDELKGYYSSHQTQYTSPEMRVFEVVKVDVEKFANSVNISDEALRKLYDANRESYALPEKRNVDQLLFNDEASAKQAAEFAANGEKFASIAKKTKPLNTEISLGFIARSEALESAADAIFEAQENSVTAPIQSPLGWHVFYVKDIDHSRQATFEDVREQLAKEQQQTQAEDQLYKHIEALENATLNNVPLAQVAKDHGETVSSIGPVSVTGMTNDGTALNASLPIDQWLEQGFSLQSNQTTSAIRGNDSNYYLLSVTKILAPRTKTLDEVRGQVEADWRLSTLKAKLQNALNSKDTKPSDLPQIFAGLGGQSINKTITQKSADLPKDLLMDVFGQTVGGHTSAHSLPNGSLAIAVVNSAESATDEEAAAANAEDSENALRIAYSNDVYDLFVKDLSKRYHVEINSAIFKTDTQK